MMVRRVYLLPAFVLVAALASVGVAAPRNDECSDAMSIKKIPFRHVVDLRADIVDDDRSDSQCDEEQDASNSAWYRYVADRATTLDIDTLDSVEAGARTTRITAYRGSCGGCTILGENVRTPDADDTTGLSRLVVSLEADESVLIQIEGVVNPAKTTVVMRESPLLRVGGDAESFVSAPAVAAEPGGDFLVVWNQYSNATSTFRARRYSAAGAPQGEIMTVNASAPDWISPAIARAGTGFVMVWAGSNGVGAQRLNANGTPSGVPLVVSPDTARDGVVAADASGNFFVAWTAGQLAGVDGRLFDSAGVPRGAQFAIDAEAAGNPSAAMAADGSVVVAWTHSPLASRSVLMQRFDADGVSQGTPIVVSEGGSSPSVSVGSDGEVVVVWDGYSALRGQRYEAQGTPLGSAFRVSEEREGYAERPALAHDPAGGFVVTWNAGDAYAGESGVMARRFAADGTVSGPQLGVVRWNTFEPPAVSAGGERFMVSWESDDAVWTRRMPAGAVPVCTSSPREGCRRSRDGVLKIGDASPDAGDRFTWKWVADDSDSMSDLGVPPDGDSFAMCLYEFDGESAFGDATLVWRTELAGGTECAGKPCWTKHPGGFRYVDRKALSDGIALLAIESEGDRIALRGRGTRLREQIYGDDTLPLYGPILVQLIASPGACVEASFDSRIKISTSSRFEAQPD